MSDTTTPYRREPNESDLWWGAVPVEFRTVSWCTTHDCPASRIDLNPPETCKWNVTREHDPCVFVDKLVEA